MNRVELIGRLTRDPELKTLNDGRFVCNATIAVDRKTKREDGSRECDFVPVVFWQKTAEFVSNYFAKGVRIGVSGRISVRSYEDTEGKKRTATEVVVEEVDFADGRQDGVGAATGVSDGHYQSTGYKPKFDSPQVPSSDPGFIPTPDDDITLPFDLEP